MDRAALLAALRPELDRFFGKRGTRVVEANLGLIADAYDHVIDVTEGIGPIGPEHLRAGDA
jgi:hypothetical protein